MDDGYASARWKTPDIPDFALGYPGQRGERDGGEDLGGHFAGWGVQQRDRRDSGIWIRRLVCVKEIQAMQAEMQTPE
jgi:hypothetical protein